MHMSFRIAIVIVCLLLPTAVKIAEGEPLPRSGQLYFGWASTSITPDRPVAIGGQYHTRISGNVHDPLSATALAMETRDDAGTVDQAVWVSCDLVATRRKIVREVRRLVAQQLPDFPTEKIIVSATHTHTAPALTDTGETDLHPYDFLGSWAYRIPAEQDDVMRPAAYQAFLARRLSEVVIRAWQGRTAGGISVALGHAVVAHNRRAVFVDGTARMYGDTGAADFSHIEGTSDHSVDMILFWHNSQLAGLAINVYCPSQEVEGEEYLSADYWYDVRTLLREKYGAELPVLPMCGASGDQSPHLMWQSRAEEADRQRRGLSSRQEIARRIVSAVDLALADAGRDVRQQVEFRHLAECVPLPVWQVSDERYDQAKALFEAGRDYVNELASRDYINWRVARTLMARYEYQQQHPGYEAELHLMRLGDVAVATNPFELFADYGVRIKARSPATQTLVVQLTSDCAAYLPTRRAVEGGGYSARIVDGVVGPEGGDVLVEETTKLLNKMWSNE